MLIFWETYDSSATIGLICPDGYLVHPTSDRYEGFKRSVQVLKTAKAEGSLIVTNIRESSLRYGCLSEIVG
ncbi:hypothetical protein BOTNAR_0130g00100 [Botryotinia narcissicola]|uniref:Uncharacterized protein n=1 Tax=Botryotinia narcissicola TaxID=278944 RepID=A0A4Z1IXR7_9HELO|nr:hypothetical protein BOTNAR_0130g00100 [Botryotinia narcissicola]